MNYLQLSQELARKAGVSGQPASVTGQSGEMLRLVNWIAQAWTEIQLSNPRWPFLWERTTLPAYAGQSDYELPANARHLDEDEIEFYDASESKWFFIDCVPFKDFDRLYRHETTPGRPQVATRTPAGKLRFYPIPDSASDEIQITYYQNPIQLSANTDTPDIDEAYHQAIVYLALKYYGEYEQDMEVVNVANLEYQRLMSLMANEVLPDITFDREFC